jgi:hypothetical protein
MPLLTLLVAGAIVLWDRQRQEQGDAEVERAVRMIVEEIAGRRPPADPPLTVQLGMSRAAVEIIEQALAEGLLLDVDLVRGDEPPPFGDGSATHRASITAEGRRVLLLRLLRGGRPGDVRVIGYVRPASPI